MKRLFTFLALGCLAACAATGERVINRPVFGVSNTTALEIDRIALTDTATIFYIDAFSPPKQWIRIAGESCLRAGEKTYPLIGTEGITPDKELWMTESGTASFTLLFPPIDRTVKTVDFTEGDCDGCFKIFDIDLTGKATYSDTPENVPSKILRKPDMDAPLPTPELTVGETTITVHLIGYKKGMNDGSAQLFANRFLTMTSEELEAQIDASGVVSFRFDQYGAQPSSILVAGQSITVMTAPGENMDVYLNLRELCRQRSRYHKTDNPAPILYCSGKYAAVNQAFNKNNEEYVFKISSKGMREKMADLNTPEQYISCMTEQYKACADRIEQSPLTRVEKALLTIINKCELHNAISIGQVALNTNFRLKNNILMEEQIKQEDIPTFTEEDFDVLKDYKIDGYDYLYYPAFRMLHNNIFNRPVINLEHITGSADGFLFDLKKAVRPVSRAAQMIPLTDDDKAAIAEIKNPFYAQAVDTLEAHNSRKLEAALRKGGFTIREVPEVSNEELFDAIMANYADKVALVDFWATWCSPCRAAIRKTEPLKATALKHDNLVFVYLTGPSSPKNLWTQMISDIKGDHYYLDAQQWSYLCGKFGIDGIPSYVLRQKSGDYSLRNDFRNHETMKKTLLEEVAKMN
ncbi:MAG: thioredoxin [Bacteroidales bacterium]|nr:thioredoxin [Bacteroidales bacterium]